MKKLALIYDFDKTLSPKYMQEYGFFDKINTNNKEFINYQLKFSEEENCETMLCFLYHMIDFSKKANVKISRDVLNDCGKNIEFYDGVETWFDRINKYGKEKGFEIEHYIISCGNMEILEGCRIFPYFKKIFASEFLYDKYGKPYWPKLAINYTTKTQYLYKIHKQHLDLKNNDDVTINKKTSSENKIPFTNIVYFGDGDTDVPCMQIVTQSGGLSLSVYAKNDEKKKNFAKSLYEDKRVAYFVEANYSENSDIEKIIKNRINELAKEN